MYETYRRQQQDFVNMYEQAMREKFANMNARRSASPMQEEYMRRYMEDLMAHQEAMKAEQEMQREREREERRERERLEKEYAESARKLKEMGKTIVSDIGGLAKGLWNAYK